MGLWMVATMVTPAGMSTAGKKSCWWVRLLADNAMRATRKYMICDESMLSALVYVITPICMHLHGLQPLFAAAIEQQPMFVLVQTAAAFKGSHHLLPGPVRLS